MTHKRYMIAALAVALAGCAQTDATSPTVTLYGNYQLRTINGSPLPYQWSDGSVIVSDVLTLQSDGTYTQDAQFSDGTIVPSDGYWQSSNGAIQFTDRATGITFSGSLSGSVLTEFYTNGPTEVYQKS